MTIQTVPGSGQISLTCSDDALPCDDSNLVIKAWRLWCRDYSDAIDIRIHLEKNIPAGGGLGGGSSNAGTLLKELAAHYLPDDRRLDLTVKSAEIGSDVPFFLNPVPSIVAGIGEHIRPMTNVNAGVPLVMTPPLSIGTPQIYRAFDLLRPNAQSVPEDEWDGSDWVLGHNDLAEIVWAEFPQLKKWHSDIEKRIKTPVYLSGSGASLYAIFDSTELAKAAQEDVVRACPDWRVFGV